MSQWVGKLESFSEHAAPASTQRGIATMTDEPEKVDLASPDLAAQQRAELSSLFPGVLQDGVLDAAMLGDLLGVDVAAPVNGREGYGLMWAGKSEAVRSLQAPSHAALVPDLHRSVEWDIAQNVFIEGDNLEVLKLLQKAYNDQVKLIYIDPPYNTGKDFVYADDFKDGLRGYLAYAGLKDATGNLISTASASEQRAGGMHSRWLSMMYPRLKLAYTLLRQDGILFVSIDDNEVASLRQLLDEAFGPQNFLATLVWDRGHSQQQGLFKEYHEYVLVYARNKERLSVFADIGGGEVVAGAIKKPSRANPVSEFTFPAGIRVEAPDGTQFVGTWGDAETTTLVGGNFLVQGGVTTESVTLAAAWTQKGQMGAFYNGLGGDVVDSRGQKVIEFYFSSTGKLKYRKERTAFTPPTVQRWGTQGSATTALSNFMGSGLFDLPKPVNLVQDMIGWTTSDDDLVMDFFAGSGTTAHAVAEQNAADGGKRRWILVNLPEPVGLGSSAAAAGLKTVTDVTYQRVRAVVDKIEGAADHGLRVLSLRTSTFRTAEGFDESNLLFAASTLVEAAPDWEVVAQEILLKEGVRLDSVWHRDAAGGAPVVVSEKVAVVLSLHVTTEIVEAALKLTPERGVLVFLEDGLAGSDAVKANAVTDAKKLGIKLKTV